MLPKYSLSNPQNKLNYDEYQEDPNDFILCDWPMLVIARDTVCQSTFLINLINDVYKQLLGLVELMAQAESLEFVKYLLTSFDNLAKLMLKH